MRPGRATVLAGTVRGTRPRASRRLGAAAACGDRCGPDPARGCVAAHDSGPTSNAGQRLLPPTRRAFEAAGPVATDSDPPGPAWPSEAWANHGPSLGRAWPLLPYMSRATRKHRSIRFNSVGQPWAEPATVRANGGPRTGPDPGLGPAPPSLGPSSAHRGGALPAQRLGGRARGGARGRLPQTACGRGPSAVGARRATTPPIAPHHAHELQAPSRSTRPGASAACSAGDAADRLPPHARSELQAHSRRARQRRVISAT